MKDHARDCEGREYTCTCGYDAERDAEIGRLQRERGYAIRWANKAVADVKEHDGAIIADLRGALTEVGEWINGLPVPTTGATRILTIVRNALSKEEHRA